MADIKATQTDAVQTDLSETETAQTNTAMPGQKTASADGGRGASQDHTAGKDQGANVLGAFQKHQLALKRFISRYLSNAQDIEDVTQEAFLRAYGAEKTTQVRQPKSFLFRIAKNVAISQLRTKSRQITDYIEDQPAADVLLTEWSTEDEVMAQQKLGIHCEAVAALPPKCRRVYLLRKVYGMSHKEISAYLNISTSTVEKHLLKGVEACDRFIQHRSAESPPATVAVTRINRQRSGGQL